MKKILMACYGAGHINTLLPIAKKLSQEKNIILQFIGFTTAKKVIDENKIPVIELGEIIKYKEKKIINYVKETIKNNQHPDIKYEDALNYNYIGLNDNIQNLGEEKALKLLKKYGRKSYLPIGTFKNFFKENHFDLIITTNSPRFELAIQKAAHELSIKSLSITDLFNDDYEYKYICKSDYARFLTVLSKNVKEFLLEKGYKGEIEVTGNPAFDNLLNKKFSDEVNKIRKLLNLNSDHKLILWACPPSYIDKKCLDLKKVFSYLINFSEKNSDFKFIIRQHPNSKIFEKEFNLDNGIFCPKDLSLEACLRACDILMTYNSTVLFQAAMLSKKLITHSYYSPVFDPRFGLDIKNFKSQEEFLNIIKSLKNQDVTKLGIDIDKFSCDRVIKFIKEILY